MINSHFLNTSDISKKLQASVTEAGKELNCFEVKMIRKFLWIRDPGRPWPGKQKGFHKTKNCGGGSPSSLLSPTNL